MRTNYDSARAFLLWVPHSDGPRVLAFDCVPGNYFNITSEDVCDDMAGKRALLALANGGARYVVAGEVKKNAPNGEALFLASLPGDPNGLRAIRQKRLPVLEGSGRMSFQIHLAATGADASAPPRPTIATGGLPQLLKNFKSVCFGTK